MHFVRFVLKMAEKRHWGWQLTWVLFGLGLGLMSGPIGDWYDYLNQLWSGRSSLSGHKFDSSFGLDRVPGWLTLIAGWWCIAHGLDGAGMLPSDLPTKFARMRFRLRWLPVPIIGTLGTYVALAYHNAPPLVLTIDVENVPPGATVEGRAIVGSFARHESRYGATFDYLFGVNLPPNWLTISFSNQAHSEFRFAGGRLSLQNWQPDLKRMFVGIEDEIQGKAALVLLDVASDDQHAGTIRVTRQSLEECRAPSTRGACLTQVAPLSFREREVRIVFDFTDISLELYEDPPIYKLPDYN